ncbi:hypothetical protein [Actinoplanes awajinensis]|uniref:Uncharacterized protein n=1 Tax=Actinoplanes awajinensis subsp. mycoplanecinus TaxID=135947 RepID=A0A101JI14_9ACTN|nr:hypothetical protein [Actinoplanes awajinensis]KUL27169.1 hypothetical protein ADL15_36335 [Actinoplanes awajinensis subsp. mycoplanecinus]
MGSLGVGVRGSATVLFTAGVVGSVGSSLAVLGTLLLAPAFARAAVDVFVVSGCVLAAATILLIAARPADHDDLSADADWHAESDSHAEPGR